MERFLLSQVPNGQASLLAFRGWKSYFEFTPMYDWKGEPFLFIERYIVAMRQAPHPLLSFCAL